LACIGVRLVQDTEKLIQHSLKPFVAYKINPEIKFCFEEVKELCRSEIFRSWCLTVC
jgi:hypothetical protein